MTSSAVIDTRHLRKTYQLGRGNRVAALRGVDVRIDRGEMVAIMGPSGSGKSTLMHLLGLLQAPDRDGAAVPTAELRIAGRDVVSISDGERTRIRATQMGFVFQSFNLVPVLTAAENVALAAEYAGRKGRDARTAAAACLELVGLGDRGKHLPSELSGGEQQRVAIARALVNEPAIVFGDEPTGNLDSARAGEVIALMRDLNRRRGQTFVVVTHDPEVGAAFDRVIRVRDGLLVSDGRSSAAG